MNKLNGLYANAKCTIEKNYNSAKEFCFEHKGEIMIGGLSVIALGACVIVGYEHSVNIKLKEENKIDKNLIDLQKSLIQSKGARINQLEDLCKCKDEFFIETISDGLRHGSSLAARHMADLKEYYKEKAA